MSKKIYKPQTREELKNLVNNESIHLGDIDTSAIDSMSFLFFDSTRKDFSGIESWDVSNVTGMSIMFYGAKFFNADISKWNVSKVTYMNYMFKNAESFNQPLDSWDTSSVTDMSMMFYNATSFNQPLESWDTSNVEYIDYMLNGAESFNQSLDSWNLTIRERKICFGD